MAQAITLNAMFTQLAHLAQKTDYVPKFDLYMQIGLRAQNQCRATLETLAAIKNPPTVFAKQANIAAGGNWAFRKPMSIVIVWAASISH